MSKLTRENITNSAVDATKVDLADDYPWTGTHNFIGGAIVLPTPTSATDGVPLSYINSQKLKQPVRVKAQTNINLSSPGATIDGILMTVEDRVLCPYQSIVGETGIYIWKGISIPMERCADADIGMHFSGVVVIVNEGSDEGEGYQCTNLMGSDIVGTDLLVFEDIFGGNTTSVSNLMSTGLLTGGIITINGLDSTKIDISEGAGCVINNYTDPLHPIRAYVNWEIKTSVTLSYLATYDITYLAINSSGTLVQSFTPFTLEDRRDLILLGGVGHPSRSQVNYIADSPVVGFDTALQLADFLNSFGHIFNITGNIISANGTNLSINRSEGTTFYFGGNYSTNKKNPNIIPNVVSTTAPLFYTYRNTSNAWTSEAIDLYIHPNFYDPGSSAGKVAVTVDKWTIQYIFFFSAINIVCIQYGQTLYNDKTTALTHIADNFTQNPDLGTATFRGYLIVKQGTTDLSDTDYAIFQPTSVLGLKSLIPGFITGEVNTMSNIGSSGVGVYEQKVEADFQLKNLKAASSKITVVNTPGTHTIDFDLVPGNISHTTLTDVGTHTHTTIDSELTTLEDALLINGTATSQISAGLVEDLAPVSTDLVIVEKDSTGVLKKVKTSNLYLEDKWKQPVTVRAIGNINLSSPGATIDTVSLSSGNRVCCDRQTVTTQDGLYIWNGAAVPMTRAADAQAGASFSGAVFTIGSGTDAHKIFKCINHVGFDVIGTDAIELMLTSLSPTDTYNIMSTGLLSGGVLSVNLGDNTKFDITSGSGYTINNTDPLNPTNTPVTWSVFTAVTTTYLATSDITYIALDSTGAIVQSTSAFTAAQRRDYIVLGVLIHISRTKIDIVASIPIPIIDVNSQLYDFLRAFGSFNIDGNSIAASGANLSIQRSAGTIFFAGANYHVNNKSPNYVITDPSNPHLLFYTYRNVSTVWTSSAVTIFLDPDYYDPGGGAGKVALVGGNWTIQYFWYFASTNAITVQYGQKVYASKTEALAGINEPIVIDPDLSGTVFRGYLLIEQGTTDLSDTAHAVFIEAGKFGLSSIITGGTGGESNTASNIGTSGVGVYVQKLGVDLQFKNIVADSSKALVTDHNGAIHTIGIDVVPGNILHQDLSGAGTNTHTQIDSHISDVSNPHSVTNTQVGLGSVTNDAQLKRAANDFSTFSVKATPITGDILLIEDSADTGIKKYSTLGSISHTILSGIGTNTHSQIDSHISDVSNPHLTTKAQVGLTNVTDDAQLKRISADFATFTSKPSLDSADIFLIEDSASVGAKKYSTIAGISHTTIADVGTNTHSDIDSHLANTSNPHSTTSTQVGLGSVTNDAQLKRAAGDFSTFGNKATLVSSDVLLIEDSAETGTKKYSTVNGLVLTSSQVGLGNVTNDAQLKRSANDFGSFTLKTTPVTGDILLIEDSNASGVKKAITAGSLVSALITTLPKNYIDGLGISRNITNPAYQVTIASGICRSDDNTTNLEITVPITVDLTISGVNGLDTGVEAVSTWYNVWLIYNPGSATYAGLLSTSSTSPTLPSGYTKKRRIGTTYNNSASNFRGWTQVIQNGSLRRYVYDEESFTGCYLVTGSSLTAFTTIPCNAWIPSTSTLGIFNLYLESSNNTHYLTVRPNGSIINPGNTVQYGRNNANAIHEIRTSTSQEIQYRVSNSAASGSILIVGFVDTI